MNPHEVNGPGITSRPKLTFIVTSPLSVGFYKGQLSYLVANGWDVEMISSPGPLLDVVSAEGATPRAVHMEREIAPLKDIVSLWRLWRLFRRTHPDLVIAGTPKAGLLGTLAARLAGVPHVVYILHGLRLETASGWKRRLLWSAEWIACHVAHHVQSVSPSLRVRVIGLGLVAPERCRVIGSGTVNGVDIERWLRTPEAEAAGRRTRERLGIPQNALLIGFVGRLTRDKGVAELYEAFTRLRPSYPDLRLLLLGEFEKGDAVPAEVRQRIEADAAVICPGFISEVETCYWAMDVFALPTRREGFPGSPLEAQVASLPVVTTDATGAADAILGGVTGLRVPVGDVDALTAALDRLLGDPVLRASMGQSGRAWVQKNFQRELVWAAYARDYEQILKASAFGGRHHLLPLV